MRLLYLTLSLLTGCAGGTTARTTTSDVALACRESQALCSEVARELAASEAIDLEGSTSDGMWLVPDYAALTTEMARRVIATLDHGCLQRGDARACFWAQEMYKELVRDHVAAHQRALRGCELNHDDSCASAGWYYWRGERVAHDMARATELLTRGCQRGHLRSCSILRNANPTTDPMLAYTTTLRQCESGQQHACADARRMYDDQFYGPERVELRRSNLELLERACRVAAADCVGVGYLIGRDTPANSKQLELYELACTRDRDPIGCRNAGIVFEERGERGEAASRYETACKASDEPACRRLDGLDPVRSAANNERACVDRGDAAACVRAGQSHARSTEPSAFERALVMYARAGASGRSELAGAEAKTSAEIVGTVLARAPDAPSSTVSDYCGKGIALACLAACERGHNAGACGDFARKLQAGAGVAKDPRRAHYYFARACAAGSQDGCASFERGKPSNADEDDDVGVFEFAGPACVQTSPHCREQDAFAHAYPSRPRGHGTPDRRLIPCSSYKDPRRGASACPPPGFVDYTFSTVCLDENWKRTTYSERRYYCPDPVNRPDPGAEAKRAAEVVKQQAELRLVMDQSKNRQPDPCTLQNPNWESRPGGGCCNARGGSANFCVF